MNGSAPCSLCSKGTYSTETAQISESTCSDCPAHTYSPDESTLLTNCTCNKGYTGPDGKACAACIAGTYKDVNGLAPCAECPAGKYSSASAATAASSCIECPAYTRSPNGSASVLDCTGIKGHSCPEGESCVEDVKLHIILAVLVPVAVAAAVSSLLYRSTHLGLVRHIIFPCTIRLRKDADAELGDMIGVNSVTPQYANESKARRAGAEDGPVGDGDGDGGKEANTARNAQPKAAPAQLAGANDGPAGDGDGDGAGKANAAGNARGVGVPSSIEKKMELAARRQALEKSKAIISALDEPLPRRHGCGPI